MSNWDPNSNYAPGGAPTDGGAFPVTGTGSSATQDSIYGVSQRLGVVPVRITNDSFASDQANKLAYMGEAPAQPPQVIPWESALAMIYRMSPSERSDLQQKLYAAGLYPKSYYGKNPDIIVPGEIDSGTETAWRSAVEEAVRSSTYDSTTGSLKNAKSIEDVINERIKLTGDAGTAAAGRQNPVQLTNPTDLRQIAKEEGQSLLGRSPDPSFVDNFVAAYHGMEVAGAQPDPTTGNVTAAPNARAFAQQLLRQQFPVDVGVNDYLNVGNELVNELARPVSGPTAEVLPTTRTVNG